jgi:teichuronic acid biosynthesis glycosyltransferase TuaH
MRILYGMHINWAWIRQRPHVIAEALSETHLVRVFHPVLYRKKLASKEPSSGPARRVFFKLPDRLQSLHRHFASLSSAIVCIQLRLMVTLFRPDIVWVTHPVFHRLAGRLPKGVSLIYDCMDDHMQFQHADAGLIASWEARLCSAADLVIFSSASLSDRIRGRYPSLQSCVVNNGCASYLYSGNTDHRLDEPRQGENRPGPRGKFIIGYIGTVAEWFDWVLVRKILEQHPNVEFRIAGPVEKLRPKFEGLIYAGVLRHAELSAFAADCDALIMPFILCPLVETVDPVKLYEYIAFNKPAFAPAYAESIRFKDHVRLYKSHEDLLDQIADQITDQIAAVMEGQQVSGGSKAARLDFLMRNSWENRVKEIEQRLAAIPTLPAGIKA